MDANVSLVEAASELSEAGFDQFLTSDLAKDIPIVGTAIKICTAIDNIRNRLYAAKLRAFISELENIPADKKESFRRKIAADSKQFDKLGENILLLLERTSDVEKPAYLASVFLAYLDGIIDRSTLRRLWEAIADAFVDDLTDLLIYVPQTQPAEFLRHLSKTGLTKIESGKTWDDLGDLYFIVSELGADFIRAHREVKKRYG